MAVTYIKRLHHGYHSIRASKGPQFYFQNGDMVWMQNYYKQTDKKNISYSIWFVLVNLPDGAELSRLPIWIVVNRHVRI